MSKQTSLRYNNIRVKNLYALARRFNGLCVIIDSMAIKYACICWCQWFLKQVSSHSLCNFWMRRPYPRGYTCDCFSFGPPFLSRILLVLPREQLAINGQYCTDAGGFVKIHLLQWLGLGHSASSLTITVANHHFSRCQFAQLGLLLLGHLFVQSGKKWPRSRVKTSYDMFGGTAPQPNLQIKFSTQNQPSWSLSRTRPQRSTKVCGRFGSRMAPCAHPTQLS